MHKSIKLILSVVGINLIGASGALVTNPSSEWFVLLEKPSFQPPNWVFGPVWTLLFTLMGVSFYLLWKNGFNNQSAKFALYCFILQMILNVSWSFVYFGLHQIGYALGVILILWVLILLTAITFGKVNRLAGLLFIPYFLWVGFATMLNYSLWQLN